MGTRISETAQKAVKTVWACIKVEAVEWAEVKKFNDRLYVGAKVDGIKKILRFLV